MGVDEFFEKERVDLELKGVLVVYKFFDGEIEKFDFIIVNFGVDEVEKLYFLFFIFLFYMFIYFYNILMFL